eukprot:m.80699 g.80699  ORF g.80699 m.80699 type:complete len:1855 (-) comp12775_c0_seq2:321-5885(-)
MSSLLPTVSNSETLNMLPSDLNFGNMSLKEEDDKDHYAEIYDELNSITPQDLSSSTLGTSEFGYLPWSDAGSELSKHAGFKMSAEAPIFKPTEGDGNQLDPNVIQSCCIALGSSRMVWSQNAMQARSWRAVSKMIDLYTRANDPEGIYRWYNAMRANGMTPTKATFDSAIEVYSHTGFVVGAMRWLSAMCLCNITPDESTFRWAKRACARASSVPEAEWCFEAMVEAGLPPDVGAFTAVINVCAHAGDVEGAERWFNSMQLAGIWPGTIAYNSVINAHAQAKDVAGAERWLAVMRAAGTSPNEVTFSSVIKACALAADVTGAERWFEAMQQAGFVPNAVPFNTVLNACARARDVVKAEYWLQRMRASGLEPDQVSFNVMIKANALGGNVEGAERWFKEMREHGVMQDRKSFSALATAYAHARPVPMDRVHWLLGVIRQQLKSNESESVMSQDTLTCLIKCATYSSPPEPQMALQWFKEFVPITYTNDHIEKALQQAVGETEAKTAVGWARLSSHRSNSTSPRYTKPPMKSRGETGLSKKSMNSDNGMRNHGGDSHSQDNQRAQDLVVEIHAPEDLHRYLIGTRGVTMRSIQHESGARLFFPTTRNTPPWAEPTSKDMITVVGSQEACAAARALINVRVMDYYSGSASVKESDTMTDSKGKYESASRSSSADHHQDHRDSSRSGSRTAFNAKKPMKAAPLTSNSIFIKACIKAIDANGIISWFDAAKESGFRSTKGKSSLCAAIDSCTQAKDANQIMSWFNAMTEAGSKPSETTFNIAIKAYANSGDVAGAERWIDAMWQAGYTPNAFSFNAVINRCARAGDVLSAERWLTLMRDAGAVPNQLTFNSVIQAYTLAADPGGAVRWFKEMQAAKVPPNEKTFSSIVNAHAQAKDVSGAEQWFEAMQRDGFKPDVVSFNTIINACAQVRDVARAERWLEAMRVAGLSPNQVTFNVMIKAHALSGDAQGAERWFEQMKEAGFSHNLRSFSSMATAYGQAFTVSLEKVEAMVAEMSKLQLYPDHEVLTSLLKCCAHASPPNPERALAWFHEFIPHAHLMAHVERALRQAVGGTQADVAIAAAKQAHPQLCQLQPLHGGRGSNTNSRIEGSNIPRTKNTHDNTEIVMEIHAPEKCHRYLIGIRGAAIKQIQNKAGAYVFFPNTKNTPLRARPTNKDAITIVGDKLSCERAQELIFSRLRNCRAYVSTPENSLGSIIDQPNENKLLGRSHSESSIGLNRPSQGGTFEIADHESNPTVSGSNQVRVPDGLSVKSLEICAGALRSAGMAWSRSAMVLQGVENAEPSRMIDMCTGASDTQGVVEWFHAMEQIGCKPTEVTFTSAIKAYGYKKNVRAAEFWFEAMKLVGLQPNEKAYSSIINAYARAKDVNGAEMWFRKMRESGLRPDHVAYNIMINAYTTVKDLNGAERWFDDMRAAGFGRSQPLYASMAVAYSTARRVPFAKVKALVEDMKSHGMTPDCDTLSSLLKCCARACPPQLQIASVWFQEFIRYTYLSPTIEKGTLPLAVGPTTARELCAWAWQTYPECSAPRQVAETRNNIDPFGVRPQENESERRDQDLLSPPDSVEYSNGGHVGPIGRKEEVKPVEFSLEGEDPWAQTELASSSVERFDRESRPPLYARAPPAHEQKTQVGRPQFRDDNHMHLSTSAMSPIAPSNQPQTSFSSSLFGLGSQTAPLSSHFAPTQSQHLFMHQPPQHHALQGHSMMQDRHGMPPPQMLPREQQPPISLSNRRPEVFPQDISAIPVHQPQHQPGYDRSVGHIGLGHQLGMMRTPHVHPQHNSNNNAMNRSFPTIGNHTQAQPTMAPAAYKMAMFPPQEHHIANPMQTPTTNVAWNVEGLQPHQAYAHS